MDADEFRDYILGFIFYKYLSEKQYLYANQLLETEAVKDYALLADAEDIEAIKEESLTKLGYFLRPDELFSAIAKKGNADTEDASNFILEDLQAILNSIEQSTMGTESEDDFNKLFEDLDLGSTKLGRSVDARNRLISRVLAHLDKIDFALDNIEADVLGDAYEYLIAQFASGAGKKAGEFYTPQQVSKILAKIVTTDKKQIKSAYDPTCGSGSLLLRVQKEVDAVGEFYGQELNRTTFNLARMNMILHDVHFSKFDIRQEDTLEEPQHLDQRFEAIVAIVTEEFDGYIVSNEYSVLRPKANLHPSYLQQLIHSIYIQQTFFHSSIGVHIEKMIFNLQGWFKLKINLPSLPEQQKIASFLTAVDTKIEQLRRKQSLLEAYKKGCMQQLFSQQLRFKDDQGNPFPDGEEKTLGNFCKCFSGGTPSSAKKSYYNGSIPFIRSAEISSKSTALFLTQEGYDNSAAKLVKAGDLLVALYGANSGEVGIAQITGAINQAILCIRTEQSNQFLFFWLEHSKDRIVNTYIQGGQGNLSGNIIQSLKVELPHPDEQQKIADFLTELDRKIDLVRQEMAQAKNFKKGLLQQMFV